MSITLYTMKEIKVIIEGEHLHFVTDVLDRIKASGYTIFSNISGKGHSGFTRKARPLRRGGSRGFILGNFIRSWFYWFIRPIEWTSLTLRLSPTAFNLLGVAFGVLAASASRPVE